MCSHKIARQRQRKRWKEGSLTNFGEVGRPSQWADAQWISLNPRCSWSCVWLTSMWDQRLPGQALPQRTLPLPPQCSCGSQAPGPLSLKRPNVNGFSHPDNQQLSTTCPLVSWEKDCFEKLFGNEDASRQGGTGAQAYLFQWSTSL